jgi:hypothetical protein
LHGNNPPRTRVYPSAKAATRAFVAVTIKTNIALRPRFGDLLVRNAVLAKPIHRYWFIPEGLIEGVILIWLNFI